MNSTRILGMFNLLRIIVRMCICTVHTVHTYVCTVHTVHTYVCTVHTVCTYVRTYVQYIQYAHTYVRMYSIYSMHICMSVCTYVRMYSTYNVFYTLYSCAYCFQQRGSEIGDCCGFLQDPQWSYVSCQTWDMLTFFAWFSSHLRSSGEATGAHVSELC